MPIWRKQTGSRSAIRNLCDPTCGPGGQSLRAKRRARLFMRGSARSVESGQNGRIPWPTACYARRGPQWTAKCLPQKATTHHYPPDAARGVVRGPSKVQKAEGNGRGSRCAEGTAGYHSFRSRCCGGRPLRPATVQALPWRRRVSLRRHCGADGYSQILGDYLESCTHSDGRRTRLVSTDAAVSTMADATFTATQPAGSSPVVVGTSTTPTRSTPAVYVAPEGPSTTSDRNSIV